MSAEAPCENFESAGKPPFYLDKMPRTDVYSMYKQGRPVMLTKVQRWGNSLGLRIPKVFTQETGLERGSVVDISVEDGHLVVRSVRLRKYALSDLLKKARPETLHEEVSTGTAVGREAW